MTDGSQADGERELVRVYERLAGQNRWTGVAYDAVTGSVVATASSGTRAATRAALERASDRLVNVGWDAPFSRRGGRAIGSLPRAGMTHRDAGRRQSASASLLHVG